MPAILLIGIPIAVVVLLLGIMTLPDDEKNPTASVLSAPKTKKTAKKK